VLYRAEEKENEDDNQEPNTALVDNGSDLSGHMPRNTGPSTVFYSMENGDPTQDHSF
jgi:hypothetical protein